MVAETGKTKWKKGGCLTCPHCQTQGVLQYAWVAQRGKFWLIRVYRCTACGLPSLWKLEWVR